jgi:hypothetical protein
VQRADIDEWIHALLSISGLRRRGRVLAEG